MKPIYLHRSYFIISILIGLIIGVAVSVIPSILLFDSLYIYLAGFVLIIIVLAQPKRNLIPVGVIGGILLGLARGSASLNGKNIELEQWDFIVMIRNWFIHRIERVVPAPESKLGIAYLLGEKDGIPQALLESIKTVGLAHIVVASGAHLSILANVIRKIFKPISRFAVLFFSILFVVIFMVLIGWTPSITRAGIMCILNLIAWYNGRKFSAGRIILITAAITLIINPTYLTDLGWLLSFSSLVGIMIIGPRFTKIFYNDTKIFCVSKMLITTMSATIMTLPITLFFFGKFSIISAVANLMILPSLSYVMCSLFVVGIIADVTFLSRILSFFVTKILDYHIFVVDWFASQKFFHISIKTGNPIVFLLYIPVVFVLIFLWWTKRQKHVKIA